MIRWRPFVDPFEDMDQMMTDMLRPSGQGFMPAVDIYQTDDGVVAELPLPGIDPDNVNISIENDVLTVEGTIEKKTEVDEKNYYRREVTKGSFHRSVGLPTSVDAGKAQAAYKDGVLKITVPKAEKAMPKKIAIQKS